MKSSVALIGFMGAGKTAVGKMLAKKLNLEFVEIDSLIEEKAGKSINDIFREEGELAFRELEAQVTRQSSSRRNVVIACGGGTPLREANVQALKKNCVIVYLKAPPSTLLDRARRDGDTRPLLKVEDPGTVVRELLSKRNSIYIAAADMEVDTSRLGVETIAGKIAARLGKHEGFHIAE